LKEARIAKGRAIIETRLTATASPTRRSIVLTRYFIWVSFRLRVLVLLFYRINRAVVKREMSALGIKPEAFLQGKTRG